MKERVKECNVVRVKEIKKLWIIVKGKKCWIIKNLYFCFVGFVGVVKFVAEILEHCVENCMEN